MMEEYLEILDWLSILLLQLLLKPIKNVYFRVCRFQKEWKIRARTNGILSGEYLLDNSMNKLLEKTLSLRSVKISLEYVSSNLERILCISSNFPDDEFQQILTITNEKLKKSDEEAERLVKKAKIFIENGNFDSALRSYTLGLSFITCDSQYYNDIQRERSELIGRMGLNEKELKSDDDIRNERFSRDNVFKVHGNKSAQLSSAGDYVEMVASKEQGSYLIVTKPVAAGTTVMVEDPYSRVRFDALRWDMEYCANCFIKIVKAVFCYGCVFTVYCSEACRLEDMMNGHGYECVCLPFLHAMKISPDLHLALKTICKAGPSTLYNLYMSAKREKFTKNLLHGIDPRTGRYDSDSYYSVLHLVTHPQEEFINSFAWIAVSIAKILALKTTFFDGIESGELLGFIEFVATAFIQHATSFQFNSFSLSDDGHGELTRTSYLSEFETIESRMRNIATRQKMTAIFSLLAIMNHSCYPTAFGEHLRNGKVAVITNRSLKPGDELTFCYGYDFMTCPKKERRSRLSKAYHFQCNCAPCMYSWPTLEKIKSMKNFICTDCSQQLKHVEVKKIELSILEKGMEEGVLVLNCNRCGQAFDEQEIHESFKYFRNQFVIAKRLINENQPSEAIPLLIECIGYFQHNICPPSLEVFQTQRVLEWAYELVVHRRQ